MDTHVHNQTHSRVTQPWNKGKLTGAKPPLSPKYVWAIRTRLQLLKRLRDLALFNLAIDSKLRGCDLVGLRIADIAPHGYAVDRASVRQRKTGRPVRFEITEQTRQAIDDHLSQQGDDSVPYLFPGRCSASHLTTRQRLASGVGTHTDDQDGSSLTVMRFISSVSPSRSPQSQEIQ